jgi:phage-related protein
MTTGEMPKPLFWVGSSRKDLKNFPVEVRRLMGFALWQAQCGRKHVDAKPLKGFGGAGVLEVVEDRDRSSYRAVYTVKLAGAVYVLHSFQKKSKKGVKTPQQELDLVRNRLKIAEVLHAEWRAIKEKQRTEKNRGRSE